MASLKEIKSRIASVKGTLKITSAMKMVASAKLHKTQDAIGNLVPYQEGLKEILSNLMQHKSVNQVLTIQKEVKKVALVCFASNTSLCGAYNSSVIHLVKDVLNEYKDAGLEVTVYSIGRKMAEAMHKEGYDSPADFSSLSANPNYTEASDLTNKLISSFISGEFDKVEFIFNHHKSMAHQVPTKETFLPLDTKEYDQQDDLNDKYIVEPAREELIRQLLPKVVRLKLYITLLDAVVSEHAARMVAMQTATDNGNNLLNDITLEYNKSRQQKITNEIQDIVSGSAT